MFLVTTGLKLPYDGTSTVNGGAEIQLSPAQMNATSLQPSRLPQPFVNCRDTVNRWCFLNSDGLDGTNVPPPMFEHSAAVYMRDNHYNYEKMLIFGGATQQTGEMNDTWIYTPWSNTWLKLDLNVVPESRRATSLTTLCHTRMILHGELARNATGWHGFNDTWLFDGFTETWSRLSPRSSIELPLRNYHSATSLANPNSTCACQESVIVFGGETKGGVPKDNRLVELHCINDAVSPPVYEWRDLKPKGDRNGTPKPRQFHQMISAYNKTVMYMNGGCGDLQRTYPEFFPELWMYTLTYNKWILLDNYSDRHLWYSKIAQSVVTAVYLAPHTFLMMNGATLLAYKAYNLNRRKWLEVVSETRSPPHPSTVSRLTHGAVVIGNDVIMYGTFPGPCDQKAASTVWNISNIDQSANTDKITIVWSANPQSRPSPPPTEPGSESSTVIGHGLYAFGGSVYDQSLPPLSKYAVLRYRTAPDIWYLDLRTLQWWLDRPHPQHYPPGRLRHCGTAVNGRLFVNYGGLRTVGTGDNVVTLGDLWSYDTKMRMWTHFIPGSSTRRQRRLTSVITYPGHPSPRCLSSFVSLTNGSAVLFGGLGGDTTESKIQWPLNDMWLLTIVDKAYYEAEDRVSAKWTLLQPHDQEQYLSPRFNHLAVATGTYMVIYGGARSPNKSQFCLEDMWKYDLRSGTWTTVSQFGDRPPHLPFTVDCFTRSAAVGNKLIVVGRRRRPKPYLDGMKYSIFKALETSAWMFDMLAFSWVALPLIPVTLLSAPHTYQDFVVGSGCFSESNPSRSGTVPLIAMYPRCFAGQYSKDFREQSCNPCPKGNFAKEASTDCSKCPSGATTTDVGSVSSLDCTCERGYCNHGDCVMASTEEGPRVTCSCYVGFTGGQCQYPTYYLIGLGGVLATAIITVLVTVTVRMMKHRREKKTALAELQELSKVWNVKQEELQLIERIDRDVPGGFGEVYKAIYREMTVAVKKLQLILDDPRIRQEFAHEIEFMRSIRHPNIVLFLGAGRFEEDEQEEVPFVVLEFAARGSLTAILKDETIPMSRALQLKTALDAARGMEFLHKLQPPRIHRDLKSSNLLVTANWTVRVADFGSARIVTREGVNLPAVPRNERTSEMTSSLLKPSSYVTARVGSPAWAAPEVFNNRPYGTAADVYRYKRKRMCVGGIIN